MSGPLKRFVFLFCSLGIMFLAGWEAATVKSSLRETTQENPGADVEIIREDAGGSSDTAQEGAGQNDGEQPRVALTFDEGPSEYTQKILDVLNEKGVKATFFLQGKAVEENVAAAKAIADAGHELGSNAYTDTNLTKLSDDDLRSQLTSGFDAIKDATGTSTCLLRAPYAAFSAKNWAEGMDLVSAVVSWNLDSGDWLLPGASSVVDTVVGSVRNGNIVLLTDNDATGSQTAEALGDLIDQLQDKGYKLVTLSELVATDKDLAKELDLSQVSMPDDAVLPSVAAKDAAGDANTAAE